MCNFIELSHVLLNHIGWIVEGNTLFWRTPDGWRDICRNKFGQHKLWQTCEKWAILGIYFIYFRSFQTTVKISQQMKAKNDPSNVRCRNSNSWPLNLESPPITIRPGSLEINVGITNVQAGVHELTRPDDGHEADVHLPLFDEALRLPARSLHNSGLNRRKSGTNNINLFAPFLAAQ